MTDWMLNCNKDTLYLNVRSHSITPQIHLNCTACIIAGIVCFHPNTLIKSITSGPLLFKPHIYVSGGIKYYVCFFFFFFKKKKNSHNQHTKGEDMNKKMYPCWLNIEKQLYLLCQAKPTPSLTVRRCCDVFMLATCDASNGH